LRPLSAQAQDREPAAEGYSDCATARATLANERKVFNGTKVEAEALQIDLKSLQLAYV